MTLTFGVATPGGLFVPSLLAGASFGRLCGALLQLALPAAWASSIDLGIFALVGAAATLGGPTRMAISLTVIIVEATGDVQYSLPIMLTLMTTKWVSDQLGNSIYDRYIAIKGHRRRRCRRLPLISVNLLGRSQGCRC